MRMSVGARGEGGDTLSGAFDAVADADGLAVFELGLFGFADAVVVVVG
jgi:hypothetical protein